MHCSASCLRLPRQGRPTRPLKLTLPSLRSGPRSLTPAVGRTCDVADVAWMHIVALNPPGEASLAEARVLYRGRIQSVAGDSFSAAARPAEAWCLDSLIGPCEL